jgi:hypothetical protein
MTVRRLGPSKELGDFAHPGDVPVGARTRTAPSTGLDVRRAMRSAIISHGSERSHDTLRAVRHWMEGQRPSPPQARVLTNLPNMPARLMSTALCHNLSDRSDHLAFTQRGQTLSDELVSIEGHDASHSRTPTACWRRVQIALMARERLRRE